ncbi:MAG TPA: hypothetical protein VN787_05465 [Steroidobacteraceae bacterium]|nr:hypothetical protein [Steroidobacteraceae bacterium]
MISSNRALLAFNLIWLWEAVERLPAALDALADLNVGPPHIGALQPFAAARAALADLQSGRSVGKSVLQVDASA